MYSKIAISACLQVPISLAKEDAPLFFESAVLTVKPVSLLPMPKFSFNTTSVSRCAVIRVAALSTNPSLNIYFPTPKPHSRLSANDKIALLPKSAAVKCFGMKAACRKTETLHNSGFSKTRARGHQIIGPIAI
jgi:hypothetical protein